MHVLDDLVLRWAHLLSAVVLAGGLFFWRWVLVPAAATSSETEAEPAWQATMRRRWAMAVGIASGLLLVSGLINAVRTIISQELPPLYHSLVAVKLLVALAVFYLAAKLAGRSDSARRFQQQTPRWLSIAAVLALLLVLIGGLMRSIPRGPAKTETAGSRAPLSSVRHV